MSASDARPVPKKNTAYRHYFAIRDNAGDLVTTWAGMDSELSKDGGNFADATNEATEIQTSGCGYIDIASGEMNYSCVTLKVTVTNTDALAYVVNLFPEEAGDIRADVTMLDSVAQRATDLAEVSQYFIANSAEPITDYVADDSLLAKALTADGDISEYDDALHSLSALADAVGNIGSGGSGATNYAMTDDNVDGALAYGGAFVGVQTSGTFASLSGDTTVFHNIDDTGDAISIVYYTNIGGTNQAANILWQGYLNSGNDEVDVHVYDFVGDTWDKVYAIDGKNNTNLWVEPPMRLTSKHTGTGAELGDVYIRFSCTGQSNPSLYNAVMHVEAVNVSRSVGYTDGAYWVKSTGQSGTTIDKHGTADNPCPWADAVSMNGVKALDRFHIANGDTVTLTAAADNYTIFGSKWSLVLNGQSIDNIAIDGAKDGITGIGTATGTNRPSISHSELGAVTLPPSQLVDCGIGKGDGTFTGGGAGEYVLKDCHSVVAGSGTPDFVFTGLGSATGINTRGWFGGSNYTLDSNCTVSHEVVGGGGQTFTTGGGNVELRGISRAVTLVLSGAGTVQCTGTTGPYTISGNATTTVNLYGSGGPITNTSTGTTVNDYLNQTSAVITTGFAQGSGTGNNQIQLSASDSSTDGAYDPAMILIMHGTGQGQTRLIYQYVGSTRMATVDRNWKVNPDTTSVYKIIAHPGREHVNEGLAQGAGTGNNQIQLNALASSATDAYVGQVIFLRSGTGEDQVGLCIAYNGSTKVATIGTDWAVNPNATTGYAVLPTHVHLLSAINAEVDTALSDYDGPTKTEMDDAHALLATVAKQDVIDGIVDNILVDTGTTIPAQITSEHSTTDGLVTTVDGIVDTILADTNELQTNQGNWLTATGFATEAKQDVIDGIVDAILVDTGTTVPAQITSVHATTDALIADVYHADIHLTRDESNSTDEYTVVWYKNGIPVTSGVTVPKLQVVKRADGTDLIAATAMTEIGSTETYSYDESSDVVTEGEAVIGVATATIDAATRTWKRVLGRDSSS